MPDPDSTKGGTKEGIIGKTYEAFLATTTISLASASHSCLPCADGLASHPQRSDRTGARDRHCLLSRLEREFGVWSIIPLRTTHAHGTISFGLLAMNNLVAKSTALPCLLLLCGYKSPGYTARHDLMATRCSQYLFCIAFGGWYKERIRVYSADHLLPRWIWCRGN